MNPSPLSRKSSLKFVVLVGVVSLFADMTYEGARSVNGQFLAVLGASGTVVGIVSGFGELIGYGLRLASGYVSDRTGKYWPVTIAGYFVNLVSVPLLALARRWEVAAGLMIAERVGKAVRTPARDAMLSFAAKDMGRGWGFGLHEALDQVGAVLGPLILVTVFLFRGGYRVGYGFLAIPALLCFVVLIAASRLFPRPRDLEIAVPAPEPRGFSKAYWLYIAAASLVAAGFVDFPLIAYHFKKTVYLSDASIPVLYSVAMAVDAVAALAFGRLFDRIGFSVLVPVTLLSAFFAPLVFLGGWAMGLSGMVLWGLGMGAQESIIRAAVGGMATREKRGTAYGIFNAVYGLSWFLGSALIGVLYDVSVFAVVVFSVAAQIASIPLLLLVKKESG